MPVVLTHAQYASFDGLEQRVEDFAAALAAHSATVDEPRPVEHELVERIVAAGGWGEVTVLPPEEPETPPTLTLEEAKLRAERAVNAAAGRTRTLYITEVPGQSLTYDAKHAEAKALLAGEAFDPEAHLLIASEIAARSDAGLPAWTPEEVAQDIVSTAAQWMTVNAMIERQRRARALLIAQATTPEEAMSHAEWVWPPN